jgi:hypothetical protein
VSVPCQATPAPPAASNACVGHATTYGEEEIDRAGDQPDGQADQHADRHPAKFVPRAL